MKQNTWLLLIVDNVLLASGAFVRLFGGDANQAVASISASNNWKIGDNVLGMFPLGPGVIMSLAALPASRKQARAGV